MAELLDEIHPGEILLEEFMKPKGITARQLAAAPSRISGLVNARCIVNCNVALRLYRPLFFDRCFAVKKKRGRSWSRCRKPRG